MKSDSIISLDNIFTKTWNFLHILRRLYQESKRTRSVWRFLWNASTCVYRQSDQTGKTYNKGTILIDVVEAHVCMRKLVWNNQQFQRARYTIRIFNRRMNSICTQRRQRRWRAVVKTTATLFSTLKRHTFDAALPGIQKLIELATDFHGWSFLGCIR